MSDRQTNPMHRIADALERIAAALEVPQVCELPEPHVVVGESNDHVPGASSDRG